MSENGKMLLQMIGWLVALAAIASFVSGGLKASVDDSSQKISNATSVNK